MLRIYKFPDFNIAYYLGYTTAPEHVEGRYDHAYDHANNIGFFTIWFKFFHVLSSIHEIDVSLRQCIG